MEAAAHSKAAWLEARPEASKATPEASKATPEASQANAQSGWRDLQLPQCPSPAQACPAMVWARTALAVG